jgi:hypothetical protein
VTCFDPRFDFLPDMSAVGQQRDPLAPPAGRRRRRGDAGRRGAFFTAFFLNFLVFLTVVVFLRVAALSFGFCGWNVM